jgi:hypothetical protein
MLFSDKLEEKNAAELTGYTNDLDIGSLGYLIKVSPVKLSLSSVFLTIKYPIHEFLPIEGMRYPASPVSLLFLSFFFLINLCA